MDVLNIPFVRNTGIVKGADGELRLVFDESVQNHLQTIHASALFTLAEAATGEALQAGFPELVGKVVPVLRDSQIKFRKPAKNVAVASPSISDEVIQKFMAQFERKGRSSIAVEVDVKSLEGEVICNGTFNWFVQRIPDEMI